jgi:hypothetical protein
VQLLKSLNIQSTETIISLDIISSFTVVQDEEIVQLIRNKLHSDHTLVEWSKLLVEATMKLLELCLKTAQFWLILTERRSRCGKGFCLHLVAFDKLTLATAK